MNFKNTILLFTVLFGILHISNAQLAIQPAKSPLAMATVKSNDTYIKITYSQPHKRGRAIFGNLVPYGKIWRTGANDATEITLTKAVYFNEQRLEAGTYSVYSIPNKKEWTIVFNAAVGQWGAVNYKQEKDVLRIKVPVQHSTSVRYEPFTIDFEKGDKTATLNFKWDDVIVGLPIRFN